MYKVSNEVVPMITANVFSATPENHYNLRYYYHFRLTLQNLFTMALTASHTAHRDHVITTLGLLSVYARQCKFKFSYFNTCFKSTSEKPSAIVNPSSLRNFCHVHLSLEINFWFKL